MKRLFSVVTLLLVGCTGSRLDHAQARLVRAQSEIARLSAAEMPGLFRDVTHLQTVLDRTLAARIDEERRAQEAQQLLRTHKPDGLPPELVTMETSRTVVNPSDMHAVQAAILDLEVRTGLATPSPHDDADTCPHDVDPVSCAGELPMLVCSNPGGTWLLSTRHHRAEVWALPSEDGVKWTVLHVAAPSMVVLARSMTTGVQTAHVMWLANGLFPLAGWPMDGASIRVADLDGDGQQDVVWRRGGDTQALMQDGGPAMAHVAQGRALQDLCGSAPGADVIKDVCQN